MAPKNQTKEPDAPTQEELDMAKKAQQWGGFTIDVGVVPAKAASSGTSKYDWASFPAPSNPEDSSTWPSVFIPDVKSGKSIYTSIKKFKAKVQAENETRKPGEKLPVPDFMVSVSKDPKGVRIIRKS